MAQQAALSVASQPGPLVAGRKPAGKQARAAPRATCTAERSDSAFDEEALQPLEEMGPISDAQSCHSSALVRRPNVPPGVSCPAESPVQTAQNAPSQLNLWGDCMHTGPAVSCHKQGPAQAALQPAAREAPAGAGRHGQAARPRDRCAARNRCCVPLGLAQAAAHACMLPE